MKWVEDKTKKTKLNFFSQMLIPMLNGKKQKNTTKKKQKMKTKNL